ncbi:hypothetical protein [Phenylobacterium sp.]|uniref:hypothetical protein n=1 Tax=Phenylobacterium sp. TaxID=1871053 RepID=UPI002FC88663
MTLGECRRRSFRLMVTCGTCRAEREVRLAPDKPTRLEDWRLRDMVAQGLFRCRVCGNGANKVAVRAQSQARGLVTIAGFPSSAFGQLPSDIELHSMHDEKGPSDESAGASQWEETRARPSPAEDPRAGPAR